MVSKFGKYDYEAIRRHCWEKNQCFTDYEFLELCSTDKLEIRKKVRWMRPIDIEERPKFTVDGATRGDVGQGGLGDCWAISAMASLSGRPDLLKVVIPDLYQQVLYGSKYCGILRFRFYHFGSWTEVVIDDILPFKENGALIFAHNPEARRPGGTREWWLSLLEKAYAKLEGGYENLKGGLPAVALTAFTGGFCEDIYLTAARNDREVRRQILSKMKVIMNSGGLICLGTENKDDRDVRKNGLVNGHAYSVTKIFDVKGLRTLIRIRNPWGKTDWTGNVLNRYSDWQRAPQYLMREIGYRDGKDADPNDGEFVMSIDDMVNEFMLITLCTRRQTLLDSGWKIKQHRSMWVAGSTDGGNRDNKSFAFNPQLSFSINTTSKVRIDLEQKVKDKQCHSIGLYVFKDKGHKKKNGKIQKFVCPPTIKSEYFTDLRSINISDTLQKGDYVVVPCTYDPHIQAKFLLTISVQQQSV